MQRHLVSPGDSNDADGMKRDGSGSPEPTPICAHHVRVFARNVM
jgi:hypothetical protein